MFSGGLPCHRSINMFTALSSVLTLIIIAVDRYRRIRKPLKTQISSYHAKLSLIPIIIIALFFSSPSLFIYGLRTVDSGSDGITGFDCTISDEAKTTVVPIIYNCSLFLCFVILATSLVAMYSLILRSLKKHAITLRETSIGTMTTGTENLPEPCSITDNSTSRGMDVENPLIQDQRNQFSNPSQGSAMNASTNTDQKGEAIGYSDNEKFNVIDAEKVEQTTSQSNSTLNKNFKTLRHYSSSNIKAVKCDSSQKSSLVLKVEKNIPTCKFKNTTVQNKHDESIISSLSSNVENTNFDNVVNKDCIIKNCIKVNDEHTCQSNSLDNPQYCPINKDNNDYYYTNDNRESYRQRCSIKNTQVCEQPKDKVCHVDSPLGETCTPHHASFDVNCITPKNTDERDIKRTNSVLITIFDRKRRMSETPILCDQELRTQGYTTFKSKAHENIHQDNHMRDKLVHKKHKKPPKQNSKQRSITKKTTIIAFVVTLVFILSFVPHLCLQVANIVRKGFNHKLQGAHLSVYNIFLRSYFINNVANPIIYGVLNENFRTEVKLVLARLRCWKPRKI